MGKQTKNVEDEFYESSTEVDEPSSAANQAAECEQEDITAQENTDSEDERNKDDTLDEPTSKEETNVNASKKTKNGRTAAPQKSSDKPKKPAPKKRKLSEEPTNKENGDQNDHDAEKEPSKKPKGKQNSGTRKKSDDIWTEEQERALTEIVKKHVNNDLTVVVPWKKVYADFKVACPECEQRELIPIKTRWFYRLRDQCVELTDEQASEDMDIDVTNLVLEG
ncbi:hypothetical protein TWF694_007045 [Orbilia ellipsospora]|uniref:Uncharacterized protein n=1 Tax=Orbilia ellipsospora TaxID=2528407 RepID=A0AAV9XM11_9PEZI